MIEQLTPSQYRQMRWKNGAGYTLELARSEGESLAEFDWRISMADVSTSGSFSQFNGMQRILTVLEGAGIELNIEGDSQTLTTLQSAQFSGSAAVNSHLQDGPIRDFNLIYDPHKYAAHYQWFDQHQPTEILSSADVIFIFQRSPSLLDIRVDGQKFQLEHQHSLNIQIPKKLKHLRLSASSSAQYCLIELTKI